jgi:uncharacterized protein YbjT (DUF2867 family)
MICVTGASGTLSSEVIKQLEREKAPFRAAYFSDKAAQTARAKGIEAVSIDYNQPETLRAAFQGCDSLFLLGPNALNQSELEVPLRERNRLLEAGGYAHVYSQTPLAAEEMSHIRGVLNSFSTDTSRMRPSSWTDTRTA